MQRRLLSRVQNTNKRKTQALVSLAQDLWRRRAGRARNTAQEEVLLKKGQQFDFKQKYRRDTDQNVQVNRTPRIRLANCTIPVKKHH